MRVLLAALAWLICAAAPATALSPAQVATLGTQSVQPATLTLLAAMTSKPAGWQIKAIDGFIAAAVQSGVWSKLDAIYLFAEPTAQAALLNLKAPGSLVASAQSSPSFAANSGYTTDGVASYIDLGFNASTAGGNYARDSASFGIFSLSSASNAQTPASWFEAGPANGLTLTPRSGSVTTFRINQAALSQATLSPVDGSGLFAVNRSASAATSVYREGVALTVTTNANQTSTALNNHNWYLGHSSATGFAAFVYAGAFFGASLQAEQHRALAGAFRTYMHAVGAI